MDNEIQDKYMDAVLAMLMDEYAEAEAEMLLQNSKDEIPEVEMPEELDRKCQALIRKKFVRFLPICNKGSYLRNLCGKSASMHLRLWGELPNGLRSSQLYCWAHFLLCF